MPYSVRVAEAARRSWLESDAEFIGRFGLSGVFVRRMGGPDSAGGAEPPTERYLDLESAATRLARRLGRVGRKLDRRLYHLRRRRPAG